MSSPAPEPTDPKEVAAAQTGTNIATGIANMAMGNMNQVNPYGSLTYEQTGVKAVHDPTTGQTYYVPTYTSTQTLSPEQQAIFDQQQAAALSLTSTGANLASGLQQSMTQPFTVNTTDTANYLYDLGAQRLDPQLQQQQAALQSQLANQGIMPGSEAYDREMALFYQAQNDAHNQLYLTGQQQAYDQLMGQHNQQINDAIALSTGTPITNPNYAGPVVPNMTAPQMDEIYQNYDAQQMAAYNSQQEMISQTLGSLGGLFSLSDRRAKEDIKKIGETEDGMGLYSYRYKGSPRTQIGLMAQEVAKKKPQAVAVGGDGLMRVNYEEALA